MRYKIGYNTDAETQFNLRVRTKQKLALDAIEYCQEFIPTIEDRTAFLLNMELEFERLFLQATKLTMGALPIKTEKKYELIEFSLSKLKSYQAHYEAIDIKLNDELNVVDTPDFNEYLEGAERIKKYKQKEQLLKALKTFQMQGGDVKPALIQKAIPNAFLYSFADNKLYPTYN